MVISLPRTLFLLHTLLAAPKCNRRDRVWVAGTLCSANIYQIPTMRPSDRSKAGTREVGICTGTSTKSQADWPYGQTASEMTTRAEVGYAPIKSVHWVWVRAVRGKWDTRLNNLKRLYYVKLQEELRNWCLCGLKLDTLEANWLRQTEMKQIVIHCIHNLAI